MQINPDALPPLLEIGNEALTTRSVGRIVQARAAAAGFVAPDGDCEADEEANSIRVKNSRPTKQMPAMTGNGPKMIMALRSVR